MSKHEQHAGHPATTAGKAGDCCGATHDHEETVAAEQGKKPSAASPASHTHASHAAGGSCGCGGKHE
jgi:hypothetical protein